MLSLVSCQLSLESNSFSKMKRSRVDTSLKTKRQIIAEIESGRRYKDVAKEFGISKSAVGRIYREREKFLSSESNWKRKRDRLGKFQKIEESCMLWLTSARAQNQPVSGPLLIEKAKYFAERFEIADFHGSDGWLSNFKMRHGISFKQIQNSLNNNNNSSNGNSSSNNNNNKVISPKEPPANEAPAETTSVPLSDWKSRVLPNLLRNYKPCDVFNVGETGLFWRMLLDKSLVLKGNSISGGHTSNEKLTLLLGGNMDGSEKLPVYVIGKNEQPRCFKNALTLPVLYNANKRAKLTRSEWESFLTQLDLNFKFQERKVVILVHKYPALNNVCELSNISLVFFPPNTPRIQPVIQGIIQNFKTIYRQSLLQMYLDDLGEQRKTQMTLLDALYGIRKAWHGVTGGTIANSFRTAGFIVFGEEDPAMEGIQQVSLNLQDDSDKQNEEALIGFDGGTMTNEVPNEDFIFATVLNKFRQQESASADVDVVTSGNDELDDEQPLPSSKEAKQAVKILRDYVMSNESAEEALQNLLNLEQFIDICFKNRCQRQ